MGGVGGVGWGGLGVIIESNLNRVRLSCCWVGVGLGCDNMFHISDSVFSIQVSFQFTTPVSDLV